MTVAVILLQTPTITKPPARVELPISRDDQTMRYSTHRQCVSFPHVSIIHTVITRGPATCVTLFSRRLHAKRRADATCRAGRLTNHTTALNLRRDGLNRCPFARLSQLRYPTRLCYHAQPIRYGCLYRHSQYPIRHPRPVRQYPWP